MATIPEIVNLFNDMDDITADYIDRIELEPIEMASGLYLTGFKRDFFTQTKLELHIKEIRKVKLGTILAKNVDGWMLMEADTEMFIPSHLIAEQQMKKLFDKFIDHFNSLTSFYLMRITYKIKGKDTTRFETLLYENKRVACKEVFKYKKQYENVHVTFEEYQSNGNGNFYKNNEQENKKIHVPSDFEIITAAQ